MHAAALQTLQTTRENTIFPYLTQGQASPQSGGLLALEVAAVARKETVRVRRIMSLRIEFGVLVSLSFIPSNFLSLFRSGR